MILRELKQEDRLALRKLWSICYQSIINVEDVRKEIEASDGEIIGNGAPVPKSSDPEQGGQDHAK